MSHCYEQSTHKNIRRKIFLLHFGIIIEDTCRNLASQNAESKSFHLFCFSFFSLILYRLVHFSQYTFANEGCSYTHTQYFGLTMKAAAIHILNTLA